MNRQGFWRLLFAASTHLWSITFSTNGLGATDLYIAAKETKCLTIRWSGCPPKARGHRSAQELYAFDSHDNKTSNFYDELRERLSPLCRKGRKKGAYKGRSGCRYLLADRLQSAG